MSELRIQQRILGVDFGRARIGIAVSDELGLLAHPLETIPNRGNPASRVAQIAKEKNVRQIIVGLPRHMSGEIGASADDALKFSAELRKAVDCDVVMQDERLSTAAADRALREAGKTTRSTRGYADQVAAQMILQTHLDRLRYAADS